MSDESNDAFILAFSDIPQDLPDDGFSASVMDDVRRHRRWRVAFAFLPALLIVPFTPTAEALATGLARTLMTSIIDVEASLIAELFAPINTVGGVLSFALLLLRFAYLRIFR